MGLGTAPLGADVGDALVRAVLLLVALLLARVVLTAVLRALALVPGGLGLVGAALDRALRPGLARRLTAALIGLGVPAVSLVADLTPAVAVAPDRVDTHDARRPGSSAAPPPTAIRIAAPRVEDARFVVVVRRGDTLWDIARSHLPAGSTTADVARAWPRWYAANRAAIGPDPALLRPGTRLRSPDRRRTGTSAPSHDRPAATGTDPSALARSLDPDRR